MIDEALDEIETVEADMLELLSGVLGREKTQLIANYIEAAKKQPRLETLTREASPGSSTAPPETP